RAAFACRRPGSRGESERRNLRRDHPMAKLRSPAVVAIGSSTGGTEAVEKILTQMAADCPGIVIAQHIPARFSLIFAGRLAQVCRMQVKEAETGDTVRPGLALIAPGDQHML